MAQCSPGLVRLGRYTIGLRWFPEKALVRIGCLDQGVCLLMMYTLCRLTAIPAQQLLVVVRFETREVDRTMLTSFLVRGVAPERLRLRTASDDGWVALTEWLALTCWLACVLAGLRELMNE
jgi:hypothetical protein